MPRYDNLYLDLCDSLTRRVRHRPYFTYNHSADLVSGDGCGTGSSSISGLAFLPSISGYPASYDSGLFFADYTRQLHLVHARPTRWHARMSAVESDVRESRAGRAETDGGAVFLTIAPTGDLIYADYDRGEVRRIHYYGGNVPPVALHGDPVVRTRPAHGLVQRERLERCDRPPLTYAWDLDGDGQYDDATGVTTSRTYSSPAMSTSASG